MVDRNNGSSFLDGSLHRHPPSSFRIARNLLGKKIVTIVESLHDMLVEVLFYLNIEPWNSKKEEL